MYLSRSLGSRRGPLSSGVIMCMYRNFTVRLVTVYPQGAPYGTELQRQDQDTKWDQKQTGIHLYLSIG